MKGRGKVTKSHARGVVILIFIVLIIQALLFVFNSVEEYNRISGNGNTTVNEPGSDAAKKDEKNRSGEKQVPHNGNRNIAAVTESGTSQTDKVPFYFDPNTIEMDGLLKLGLSKKEARVIVNYRSKGGKFKRSDDLSKIYLLTKENYNRIKDYVVIPEEENNSVKPSFTSDTLNNAFSAQKPAYAKRIIDLNSADSIDLISLPGIGPYFAGKIIDYRARLGGFASSEQLMDIYGIDKERYSVFCDKVWADKSKVVKIKLSEASADDLARNPYIGAYVARSIVRFRESTKNDIVTVAALVVNKIIKEEIAKILEFYLE
ncbi:MAG: helix-hairpin-helix domain-containing protein [Bacteroidales bacterium]|nr:helix-hairpin-helix domain-containing protein [Bacteroidales bacterium]